MSRDTDRARVYGAEELVFAETLFTEQVGATGVLDLARLVTEDAWWQRNGVDFEVVPTRRESAHSSAQAGRGEGRAAQIRLTIHQEDAATLTHELAHLLANAYGSSVPHGALFRAAELDVASLVCGPAAASRLGRAFHDVRLRSTSRRWEVPPDSATGGLYGRLRVLRQTQGVPR